MPNCRDGFRLFIYELLREVFAFGVNKNGDSGSATSIGGMAAEESGAEEKEQV